MAYRLISPDGTQSFDLHDGAPLIVGRAPTCDLPVFDPTISRRHAELVADDDRRHRARPRVEQRHVRERRARSTAATLDVDDLVTFGKVAFRLDDLHAADAAGVRGHVSSTALGPTIVRQIPMRDSRAGSRRSARRTPRRAACRGRSSRRSRAPASDKSQQKLATLLEVSKGLTRAVDVDTLLDKIVGYAYQTLDVDRVAILLLDEQRRAGAEDLARQARRRRRRAPCRSRSRGRR